MGKKIPSRECIRFLKDAFFKILFDTAKSYHNIWPSNTDTTVGVKIPVIIEVFKKQREFIDGNLTIGGTIYEVVTMPDGNKYGHSWVEMSWKSKKGVFPIIK